MDSERVRKNVEGRKLMDYSGISQSDTIPHFLPYLSLFHEKVARNKQVQWVCVVERRVQYVSKTKKVAQICQIQS